MEYWESLVGKALMGTDRQPPVSPKTTDPLATTLNQLDWTQAERAMLSAAGAISVYQQVGQLPVKTDWPGLDPCSLDDLPCCSDRTARHLGAVMTDYPDIMPELLQLMASAHQRVPERLLPKLLNLGRQRSDIRPYITAVIGKRGQWLARQNSVWEYGLAQRMADFDPDSPAAQTLWREGSRSERALFLQQWREWNAQSARDALAAVWSSELAKDREALIAVLTTQLSMADEPFLEKALSDRAQAVRQQAVELLVKLPESRLCHRMAERIEPFITIQTPRLAIKVVLPKAFEPTWEKDGMTAKKVAGLGDKASWLYQMITGIPLSHWSGEPAAIVQAIQDHKWQDMLLKGLGVATLRQQNILWANALVNQFDLQQIDERLLSDLLTLLTMEQQEIILRDKLPSKTEDIIHWLHQVARCAQTWSLEFSKLVLEQVFRLIRNSDLKNYSLSYLLKEIAVVLHPNVTSILAEKINQLPDNNEFYWAKGSLDDFYQRMCFRDEMRRAFESGGCPTPEPLPGGEKLF